MPRRRFELSRPPRCRSTSSCSTCACPTWTTCRCSGRCASCCRGPMLILMTAFGTPEVVAERARSAPRSSTKPFELDELKRLVDQDRRNPPDAERHRPGRRRRAADSLVARQPPQGRRLPDARSRHRGRCGGAASRGRRPGAARLRAARRQRPGRAEADQGNRSRHAGDHADREHRGRHRGRGDEAAARFTTPTSRSISTRSCCSSRRRSRRRSCAARCASLRARQAQPFGPESIVGESDADQDACARCSRRSPSAPRRRCC